MFVMLIICCKIQKKLLQITIPLRKYIQIKVYSHPVKNVWISSLTLILIFWWTDLAILRSHRKVYQNIIFNFEDIWKRKFVFHQTLIAFFHTRKTLIPNVGRDLIQWWILYVMSPYFFQVLGDSPDIVGLLAKKEVGHFKIFFFCQYLHNWQSILLTFLWLLRIVS